MLVLFLGLLLAGFVLQAPFVAAQLPLLPPQSDLSPQVRDQLTEAARNSTLAPWQREFMHEVARNGVAGAAGPALSPVGTAADDGAWAFGPPSRRIGHTAIYDPVRDRMVVFGGRDDSSPREPGDQYRNDVWALSLAGTPTWTSLTPAGSPPSARTEHAAIYDPVRDRMVVFGGQYFDGSNHYFNDVWALSLAGSPAWSELSPAGSPPSERRGHTAIYDPVRDRMVVFGGFNGIGFPNDAWALSLAGSPAWTSLTPAGNPPSAREKHAAIYDPVRDRMVVFGGRDASLRNDVWALSLAGNPVWSELSPAGSPPSGRYRHTAIYDPVRDRMTVFGGRDTSGLRNDSWALSLAGSPAWSELSPAGSPPFERQEHTAIYDPVRDRMVVFGGRVASGIPRNDVWALSLAGSPAWSKLSPAGASPRDEHTAIYDPVRDRMVVFGGYDGTSSRRNDVWALSLAGSPAWSELFPAGSPPSGRYGHTAFYDPVRDRMLIFAGYDGTDRNDVWALSLAGSPAWSELSPVGSPPPGGSRYTAIYDPVRDRMVVFGGQDVWALSLAESPAWSELFPAGSPPSVRGQTTAIYDPVRDRMVVFGGYYFDGSNNHYLNDVWALSLAGSPAWSELFPAGSPPAGRYGHTAIYDSVRDRMAVFAGMESVGLNDVWVLSLAGSPAWSELSPAGSLPSAHQRHTAIYDLVRDRMVVFGGSDGSGVINNEVWALSWADTTTAVLASLVSVDAQASRVRLVWYVSGTGSPVARLYRRTVDSDWSFVDRIAPDGSGYMRYEDAAVTSGTRYGYRLGIIDAGQEVFVGEVWADVPAPTVQLAMRGVSPNPSIDGRLRVEFTLHDGSPARLELIDVVGRVLSSKQVGALGPGTHLLDVSGGAALQPGIYFLRLTQGQHEVRARAAVFK